MMEENMIFKKTALEEMRISPSDLIGKTWFLLTAGTPDSYNMMTASWGAMGEIWGVPSMHCFVRTNRYTLEFLEKNTRFTASFFDVGYKPALQFCGMHSGRDCDKVQETGLQPIAIDGGVTFKQARCVLVCEKLYSGMMQADGFVRQETYQKWYAEDNPMHREFIGEILSYYERMY